jgi:hypothetical protein
VVGGKWLEENVFGTFVYVFLILVMKVSSEGVVSCGTDEGLRQCAEYRTVRVCARFEFPRAEELGASILGVCDVQGGVVFQNTYCACPRVFHVAYFRSLNIIYNIFIYCNWVVTWWQWLFYM